MNRITVFLLLFTGLFFTSCVPIGDLIYLQKKDKSKIGNEVSVIDTKPYKLQVSDIVSITIKAIDPKLVSIFNPTPTGAALQQSEQSLYFEGYHVDDHGNIRVPILGDINVLGLTLDEVRLKLEKELLNQYFNKEADIFVNVQLAGFRYTVSGEVGSPGTKTLFKERVNILEAVANSGEIAITGDRKNVMIVRQFPHGTEMHDIDLTDIEVIKSPYFYLKPNDYIYVKPLKQKSWGTGKTGIETISSIMLLFSFLTTTLLLISKI